VLPLWHKKATIVVGSDRLWIYNQSQIIELPLQVTSSQKAIDFEALNEQLSLPLNGLSGKCVTIILANSWVRYSILPWRSHLYSKRDWQAIAERYLIEIYGNHAVLWQVTVSMQAYGQPLIIAAVDRNIITGFEALAGQNKWQVTSLEPAFANVANHYQNDFSSNAWLMLAEQNRLVLAQSIHGVWQRFLVSVPPLGQAQQQCRTLVKQARQLNSTGEKMKLYVCGHPSLIAKDLGDDIDTQILATTSEQSSLAQLCYGVCS
jgi:hypothetical protein